MPAGHHRRLIHELRLRLGLFAGQLGWRGAFWNWINNLDLNTVGFVVVGMFVFTWAVAVLVWRYGRIEEKWGASHLGAESVT